MSNGKKEAAATGKLSVAAAGSLGGKARASKLSAKRRKEIARMGVDARKAKRSKP